MVVSSAGRTIADATPISLNTPRSDTLSALQPDGWYKVTLPKAGGFQIVFGGTYAASGRWSLELYDAFKERIWRDTYKADNTKAKTVCTTGLPKGTYYIRVDNSYSAEGLNYVVTPSYFVGGTSISKVTPATKAFTVSWAKKSYAAKYQMRYSTNKNMSKATTVNVASKYASKKIGNLVAKKKYFVQLRVGKTIGGKVYYSNWSAAKEVTTK